MKDERRILDVGRNGIEIYVKCGEFEEDIKGPVDEVLRALIAFLDEVYPSLEVLTKVKLTVDLHKIIEQMKDIIVITPSGPVILSKKKLSIRKLIGLNLLGAFVGYKLNLTQKASLSLDELMTLTRKTKGSISGTLTNMVNDRLVEKLERGKYKITLQGVKHLSDEVLPELK